MMSSSSLTMVYMVPYFKELLPLVYEKLRLKRRLFSKMNSFDYNSMKLGHIIKYHKSFRKAHIASCFQELLPFVNDNLLYGNSAVAGASVSHGHISSFRLFYAKHKCLLS